MLAETSRWVRSVGLGLLFVVIAAMLEWASIHRLNSWRPPSGLGEVMWWLIFAEFQVFTYLMVLIANKAFQGESIKGMRSTAIVFGPNLLIGLTESMRATDELVVVALFGLAVLYGTIPNNPLRHTAPQTQHPS